MSPLALALFVFGAVLPPGLAPEPKLTADAAKYLDKLIADFLFDPTGAQRVTGEFARESGRATRTREGWLVRGRDGNENRIFFTDGDSVPVPPRATGANFVAACRERYARIPEKETDEEKQERKQRSVGVNEEYDLTLAAWLHKLGHDDLAAKALTRACAQAIARVGVRTCPGPRELLRQQLAADAATDVLNAYEMPEDEAALELGTKLLKLYPDVIRNWNGGKYQAVTSGVTADQYWQVKSIITDLQRRKTEGTLGKRTPWIDADSLPRDSAQRVAALITALEDVNFTINQFNRLSIETLADDWRIKAIVSMGEPVLPALIDAFEKDTRRTRSLWHPSVRESLLLAIEEIMRVKVVDNPMQADLLYDADGRDRVKSAATRLRAHWDTFGRHPFAERMMKLLAAPESRGRTCLCAAHNLAGLNDRSNSCWLSELFGHVAVTKFSNPTAAEAILAARNRCVKAAARGEEMPREDRPGLRYRGDFLDVLIRLGDRRIAPALAALADSERELLPRLALASAAFQLGALQPLEVIAKELEAGTLKVRPPAPPSEDSTWRNDDDIGELGRVIRVLARSENPAVNRALWALADRKHPHHRTTVALLVQCSDERSDGDPLFRHSYWIGVARQALGDTTLTGRTWEFNDERVTCSTKWNIRLYLTPDELAKPEKRRDRAEERICDRLGAKLSRKLIGAPVFHPLRVDSYENLEKLIEFLDRNYRRYRQLTAAERDRFIRSSWENSYYIPDIKPLKRVATFGDVAAGDAVFHLEGKGKLAGGALPVWVVLKDETRGLAVQAEVGTDGVTVYGVIFTHEIRAVKEHEVAKVEPVEKK